LSSDFEPRTPTSPVDRTRPQAAHHLARYRGSISLVHFRARGRRPFGHDPLAFVFLRLRQAGKPRFDGVSPINFFVMGSISLAAQFSNNLVAHPRAFGCLSRLKSLGQFTFDDGIKFLLVHGCSSFQ
jgi:hypothetical protein